MRTELIRRLWRDPKYRAAVMAGRRAAYRRLALTPIQQFSRYAVVGNGCWEWHGPRLPKGYGMVGGGNRKEYAHRLAYRLFVGEIPDGLLVCHTCDHPGCVNPPHLFLGTQKDNMQDASTKRRIRNQAWKPGDTHCQRGHPWDKKNTYITPKGGRVCRTCSYAAVKRYEARKRATAI